MTTFGSSVLDRFLEELPVFQGLTVGERRVLARVMVVHEHPRGTVLLREGDRPRSVSSGMYVLLEGEVAMTRADAHGVPHLLRLLQPGELFGVLDLLDDAPRSASCTTASAVQVALLDRIAFKELAAPGTQDRLHAHFQWAIARQLARDIRALDGALRQVLLRQGA